MIHTHLIAGRSTTTIYSQPSKDGNIVARVTKGSWLGVIEKIDNWIRIIGADFEGWVNNADVAALPPMKLRVQWTPGKTAKYLVPTKAD